MGAGENRLGLVDASLQLQWRGHHRHHRVVAIVADSHLHLAAEVDALDELEKAVDEVLARLLAVGDDVDPGILLLLQPQQRGVAFGALELGARAAPCRP
jgi:tryptophanyl-tRNA synthetase